MRKMALGILAHVGAFRREPHFYSFISGSKTGDLSYHAEAKRFHGVKTPPYAVGSQSEKRHMVAPFRYSALQPFSE